MWTRNVLLDNPPKFTFHSIAVPLYMRVYTCTTLALCHTQQRVLKDYHIADSLWTLCLRNTTEEYVFCKSWIFCKLILPVDPHTSYLHNRTPCNPHTPSRQTPLPALMCRLFQVTKKLRKVPGPDALFLSCLRVWHPPSLPHIDGFIRNVLYRVHFG